MVKPLSQLIRSCVLWSVSAVATALLSAAAFADTQPHVAVSTFNKWCFKAGQTESQARANMDANDAAFTLTFWDDSLAPRPADAPEGIERRCMIAFDGNHTRDATEALHKKMATPPVFGTAIPLPETHAVTDTTTYIEGRELLKRRVAVVHIGRNNGRTFMAVDRLYAGLGLPD